MLARIILTGIPFVWVLGGLPFANRVYPLVLGLPFLAAWLASSCFVAFICLYILYQIHGKQKYEGE